MRNTSRATYRTLFSIAVITVTLLAQGCASVQGHGVSQQPTLTPRTQTYKELVSLPPPKGRIVAAVYNFRDQTGQYKPSPASSFSTSVTQGATAMLAQGLLDSGWFVTLEREGLQNLLTERKIIRASQKSATTPSNNIAPLPSLLAANVLFEGSIIGFDSNIRTGGSGVRYLGIGAHEQFRVDQVTVNLRAIDIRTSRILTNVSTSKTVLSREVQAGVFKYVEFKELLEMEAGVTTNEPTELCVRAAIESAILHTIAKGVRMNTWELRDTTNFSHPIISKYMAEEPVIINEFIIDALSDEDEFY